MKSKYERARPDVLVVWPFASGRVVQSSPPAVARLDEQEVQVVLRVAVDLERERRAAGRNGDRPRQPLVRRVPPICEYSELRPSTGVTDGARSTKRRRVDGIPVRDPVDVVGADVEVADRHDRKVRRHRLARVPVPRRPAAARLLAHEDRRWRSTSRPGRDRDVECERRLVARVVVGREPGRRDVRLARDDRAVVGLDEPGQRRSPRERSQGRRRSATTSVNAVPLGRGRRAGSTVSSWPSRVHDAGRR